MLFGSQLFSQNISSLLTTYCSSVHMCILMSSGYCKHAGTIILQSWRKQRCKDSLAHRVDLVLKFVYIYRSMGMCPKNEQIRETPSSRQMRSNFYSKNKITTSLGNEKGPMDGSGVISPVLARTARLTRPTASTCAPRMV